MAHTAPYKKAKAFSEDDLDQYLLPQQAREVQRLWEDEERGGLQPELESF